MTRGDVNELYDSLSNTPYRGPYFAMLEIARSRETRQPSFSQHIIKLYAAERRMEQEIN